MRFRDLLRDINRHEQKLENVLLYVDFMDHELAVILLKDSSLLTLFNLPASITRVCPRMKRSSSATTPGWRSRNCPTKARASSAWGALLKLTAGPKLAS